MRGSSWVTHRLDSPAYVAGLAGNASGAEDAESAIAKVARLARRAGPTRARRIADAARRVGSVALVTVGERRPRAVSIVLSCLTDAARFELSVGAKCHPLFKCIGAFSRVTTEHNDAREGAMPSNTLAAFAAGLFVATLVLTHDASAGDELLVARGLLLPSPSPAFEIHASRNASLPDPNVVEGRAGRDAPEGTKATDHPDGEAIDATRVSDASDATDDLSLGVRETRAPARSPRSRRARARAGRVPHDDSRGVRGGDGDHAPRAAPVGARGPSRDRRAGVVHARGVQRVPRDPLACRADGLERTRARQGARRRRLRRAGRRARRRAKRSCATCAARGRARAREALARARRRVARARDRAVAPFVAVARRVASASRSARRRYAAFIADVKTKSRLAAALAPHVIVFGVGGVVIAALPHWARAFVRKREIVASATLLVPTFFTVNALERCRAAGVDDFSDYGGLRGSTAATRAESRGALSALREGFAAPGSGLGAVRTGRADGSSSVFQPSSSLESLDGAVSPDATRATPPSANAAEPEHARRSAEAWLRFWSSAAPLMFLLDLPFVATGVHVMVPFWPRAHPAVDRVAHLPHDRRRAAHHGGCRAARRGLVGGGRRRRRARRRARAGARTFSRVGASASFFFPIRRVRRVLDRSARTGLCAAWRTGCASWGSGARERRLAWRWTTRSLPMIGCAVFFFTPTFLTLYGCATAALALPAAASLDALATKNHADGTPRTAHERSRRICAQLRYWLAYSMLWSLARELSRAARSRGSRALAPRRAGARVLAGGVRGRGRGHRARVRGEGGHRLRAPQGGRARASPRRRRGSSAASGPPRPRAPQDGEAAAAASENESRDSGRAGNGPRRSTGAVPADEAAGERQSRGRSRTWGSRRRTCGDASTRRRGVASSPCPWTRFDATGGAAYAPSRNRSYLLVCQSAASPENARVADAKKPRITDAIRRCAATEVSRREGEDAFGCDVGCGGDLRGRRPRGAMRNARACPRSASAVRIGGGRPRPGPKRHAAGTWRRARRRGRRARFCRGGARSERARGADE